VFLNYVDKDGDPPDSVFLAEANGSGATADPLEPVMVNTTLGPMADPVIRRGRTYYLVASTGGGSVLWQVNLSYNP
jgi:hypothetical protein